jgi:phosphoribosylformylglycinamidine synthase
MPRSLFGMIRHTEAVAGEGTVVAYKDNASVMVGGRRVRWMPEAADGPSRYAGREGEVHVLMKVETHNHPTAISPFPGAATGAGGEIRDEGATGRGSAPKAGLTGFAVSNLHLPGLEEPWESEQYGAPAHIASPLEIMLDGPIGAAAFNNEFGRPGLGGFFRVYEQTVDGVRRGFHKPIMSAGGLGTISADMTEKIVFPAGTLLVQIGGPGMRIGMGGGAASSMAAGANAAELDFDSVQRGNPEIERRAQEVINHCWGLGRRQPRARHPRRRRRRPVERLPRARRRGRAGGPLRPVGRAARGVGARPQGGLVQRVAGALRAGARARFAAAVRVAVRA